MLWSGQWLAAGFLTDKPKIKYGFAPLPQADEPATLYDAVGICTPSYTKNADATFKVLKYLDSTAWTKVLPDSPVAVPAYTGAQDSYFNALDKAGKYDRRLHRQDGSEGLVHHRRALHHPVGQPGRRPDHGVLARHPPGQEAAVRSADHGRQDQRSDQEQQLGVRCVHGRRQAAADRGRTTGTETRS